MIRFNELKIEDNYIIIDVQIEEEKYFKDIYIDGKDLNVDIHKTMFFVYVIAGGTPAADTPCKWDENKTLHTLVDTQVLYNNIIQYIKELSKDCSTPDNFINTILQFNAVDLALKTNQYPLAIDLWKRFYSDIESNVVLSNCACNGRL